MLPQTYSLHKINDPNTFGFDPVAYSRFKFGDDRVARDFGYHLADGFIAHVLETRMITSQLVVISSPYSFIPTATFAMKDHFVCRLNRWLAEQGAPVVQETKVHRTVTYKEDYGELDAAQRMALINNDKFHIDASFLKGKALIFLDDIKITGSHERMILKMIEEFGLTNEIHMLYFAELINRDIHPNIENHLNYYKVRSIFDLDDIINSGHLVLNTRTVKYILNYDHAGLCIFLQNKEGAFVNELYDKALGNSYHTMPGYSLNLNYIKQYLFSDKKITTNYGN